MELTIKLATNKKNKPTDESKLGFGGIFTDHMFCMNYETGKGWHDARIVPFENISVSPACSCFHYGQTVFEGLKAYRSSDDKILLFRPEENFKRLNNSNDRMCIPAFDTDFMVEALKKFVDIERDWVPHSENTSLYLRPFIIAIDEKLGVSASNKYLFMIIASPSGSYYASGLNPVNIYVENKFVRAVRGGTGTAKTGGNYASTLKSQEIAHEQNYSQVLWLDGIENKYVEEVGAMNIFFVIDNEVLTPMLNGSILAGITRKSVIELLSSKGYKVTERRISIEEINEANNNGTLSEIFGTGTAAVVSPVGELKWGDVVMHINNNKIGTITQFVYDELTGIQWGKIEGPKGWSVEV